MKAERPPNRFCLWGSMLGYISRRGVVSVPRRRWLRFLLWLLIIAALWLGVAAILSIAGFQGG